MPTHTQVSPEEDLAAFQAVPPWTPSGASFGQGLGPRSEPVAVPVAGPVPVAGSPATGSPVAGTPVAPAARTAEAPRPASSPSAIVSERVALPASTAPSPLVCAIASVFVPGLGQILCGQVTKGAVIFGVAFFSVGFCGILNLLAAFDAWRISERRARGEVVADWQFF